ncbi:hypothetical protein IQ264_24980 [Phormidium sp. LEGE 05292]|uniref:hypothetical protein n=1 Tax=[Phormidium] sp. LEGE 05292 TaxID=767427 RepID=UPI001882C651|nr:hypothetical protein [Phormidium sp. LEGE 05292]MBE9228669.1 hypothetical protein [Phormidium sp. LEGE 05292]
MTATNPYILFEEARKQEGSNPFKKDIVIANEEVWGEVISDLTSLNEHIDQAITQVVSEVRKKYLSKVGIAVQGEKGRGKSHAIRRVWKKIEREGGALFAYIPPCSNSMKIDSHVRFYVAQSFKQQDLQGTTQWQNLAASAIATLKSTEFEEQYQDYLKKCENPDELRKYIISRIGREKLPDFINDLTESILENKSGIDFYFLKAVLWLLFKNMIVAQGALSWLNGADDPNIKSAGLPEYSSEQKEVSAISIIQQICKLAELASLPVVIWFDQVDNNALDSNSVDSSSQIVAKCLDRIYFQCSNVILLSCLLPKDLNEIKQLGSGVSDRVCQQVLEAKRATYGQMIELVKMRLNWFYQTYNLNPNDYPFLYPLREEEIKEIADQGSSTRVLLQECGKIFDSSVIKPIIDKIGPIITDRTKEFLDTYNQLMKKKLQVPINDEDKLAEIIGCAISMIPEEGVDQVIVNELEYIEEASIYDPHWIVSGYDLTHQKQVTIGIRICETMTAATFNAVMKRLLKYEDYELTRGCLVRSTPVPKSWKVGSQMLQDLVDKKGGEVIVLKKEEVKHLLVLQRIYEQAEDYGFDEDEVIELAKKLQLVANNRLIREILSEGTTLT